MTDSDRTPAPVPPVPHPSQGSEETATSDTDRTVVGLPGLSDPEAWIGQSLGKYEITGVLGQGGMGLVFRGFDPTIERDVAIKVLSGAVAQDAAALQRFQVEARTAGKLSHPNVVTVYEIGQEGLTHYLVQEFVEGESAAGHLEHQGRYAPAEATRIMVEACKGLGAAHTLGLVHRDVKPANILVARDGAVKVADFGLAKQAGTGSGVTVAGQILGTPHFMSPEQCQSADVDFRSDIYSLGATYFSLLSGQSPYAESGSVMQVMFAHCQSQPPDPRTLAATVPAACVEVIHRAMAKAPQDRYASMEAMQRDLEAILAAMSGTNVVLPSKSGTSLPRIDRPASSAIMTASADAGVPRRPSLTGSRHPPPRASHRPCVDQHATLPGCWEGSPWQRRPQRSCGIAGPVKTIPREVRGVEARSLPSPVPQRFVSACCTPSVERWPTAKDRSWMRPCWRSIRSISREGSRDWPSNRLSSMEVPTRRSLRKKPNVSSPRKSAAQSSGAGHQPVARRSCQSSRVMTTCSSIRFSTRVSRCLPTSSTLEPHRTSRSFRRSAGPLNPLVAIGCFLSGRTTSSPEWRTRSSRTRSRNSGARLWARPTSRWEATMSRPSWNRFRPPSPT